MKDPLVYLLKTFLKKNDIKIMEEELTFQLKSHPSYPSLHSLTGVMDHFAIKNFALELPIAEDTVNRMPDSFLAYIKSDTYNGFAVVHKCEQGIILTIDNVSRNKKITIDEFLLLWTGIAVVIDNDDQEQISSAKKVGISNNYYLILLAFVVTGLFLYKAGLFQALHFALSIIGFAICILIKQHELGISSAVLNKICSEESKKTSCDAVLNSKGATILQSFKLSDVGITYFGGLIISWILLKISNSVYSPLVIITLLALPFTIYSIYYQYRIVKKWCLLCLSVVSVLWLQAFSLLLVRSNNLEFTIISVSSTIMAFMTVFALWQFLAQKLKKEYELDTLKIEHNRFKRNFEIFKSLVTRKAPINSNLNDPYEIVLSNTHDLPLLNVVIITNPLCGFCKEAHQLVEKLLELKDKPIKINIRFNVRNDSNATDTRIALRLMEIHHTESIGISHEALNDIYGELSTNDWLQKWGEVEEKHYNETIRKQNEWCRENNINFTPEILINGYSFPKEYSRMDLLYFIDDLIEETEQNLQTAQPEVLAN